MTNMCINMLAGRNIPAGTVCAEILNDAVDTLRVTYNTTATLFCLTQVHMYLGNAIPLTSTGQPYPGGFPVNMDLGTSTCLKTQTVSLPLTQQCSTTSEYASMSVQLAAHASVRYFDGSNTQTAWSTGQLITPKGNWATFTPLDIGCKCAGPSQVSDGICWSV